MRRTVRELGAILTATIAGVVVLVVIGGFGYLVIGRASVPFYAGVTAAAIVVAGGAAWMRTRRWLGLPALSRRVVECVLVAYALTWALGTPSVHTQLAQKEIAIYKRLKAEGDSRVWDAHPRIEFFVSIPIAPAVILSYHEYQVAGLWGEGRWDLHTWYILGTEPIIGMGTWIS
jgi:hypothetical protein